MIKFIIRICSPQLYNVIQLANKIPDSHPNHYHSLILQVIIKVTSHQNKLT